MDHFPPPSPDDSRPEPTDRRPSSRRRLALAAVAATALGVGGVVVGSQLVAAGDDGTADDTIVDSASTTDDSTTDDSTPTDDSDVLPQLPGLGELGDLDQLIEEFERCFSFEVPGASTGDGGDPAEGGWDTAFDDLLGKTVTVIDPDADTFLSMFDFGDGDGTITITQTDGEIEVTTDGDVGAVEGTLPVELPNVDDQGENDDTGPGTEATADECELLLPDAGFLDVLDDLLSE